jgi:F-type H+-transporting ATPase subunit epsilon
MADRLRLVLLTTEQQLVDDEVLEVTAPGVYGEIGVLPEHAALVTTLEDGVLSYKTSSGISRYRIGGGFAEVRDDVMTVLATSGEAID